jgi:hypothetical protein
VAWPQVKQARLAVLYQEELQAGRQSVAALPLPSKGSHDPTESQAAAFGALRPRRASSVSRASVPALTREQVSRSAWRETRNSPYPRIRCLHACC